jgi:dihydrodipicolinate synthase/N-acetylneuraminate lyase
MPSRSSGYAICRSLTGATALVLCGKTGEAPTLGPQEHDELIRMAVARSRGWIPVIAGAGANATPEIRAALPIT